MQLYHTCRRVAHSFHIAAIVLLMLSFVQPAIAERTEKEFKKSSRFLANPDCGWIAYNKTNTYGERKKQSSAEKPFPFASVIYTRHPRRAWEGADGFGDSAPVSMLESWVEHDRHIAFRVYAGRMSHLPDDLAPDVQAIGDGGRRIHYRDPDYIRDHRKLVNYLGDKWADSPHLAFVDIGGVGHDKGMWSFSRPEIYEQAGLTDARYAELVKTFVRMYEEAFPGVQLFISYKCIPGAGDKSTEVMSFLKEHGIGIRDEGLGEWPYPRNRPPLRNWPVPLLWRDVPVLFEISGNQGGIYGWEEQGNEPRELLTWALRMCRPSYINLGSTGSASAQACKDMAGFLLSNSPLVGYRFVLKRISFPGQAETGDTLRLSTTWSNQGRAPCYKPYRMEVSFWDEKGRQAGVVYGAPQPPTTKWKPLEEVTSDVTVNVPSDLEAGSYTLKVRLVRNKTASAPAAVETATQGGDLKGRFSAGQLQVR